MHQNLKVTAAPTEAAASPSAGPRQGVSCQPRFPVSQPPPHLPGSAVQRHFPETEARVTGGRSCDQHHGAGLPRKGTLQPLLRRAWTTPTRLPARLLPASRAWASAAAASFWCQSPAFSSSSSACCRAARCSCWLRLSSWTTRSRSAASFWPSASCRPAFSTLNPSMMPGDTGKHRCRGRAQPQHEGSVAAPAQPRGGAGATRHGDTPAPLRPRGTESSRRPGRRARAVTEGTPGAPPRVTTLPEQQQEGVPGRDLSAASCGGPGRPHSRRSSSQRRRAPRPARLRPRPCPSRPASGRSPSALCSSSVSRVLATLSSSRRPRSARCSRTTCATSSALQPDSFSKRAWT